MPGNKAKLSSGLTTEDGKRMPLKVRTVHITKEEASLARRRRLGRSTTAIDQMERMYIYTSEPLCLRKRPRHHFPNLSNRGNWLGPVVMPAWSATWQLPFGTKKDSTSQSLCCILTHLCT